MIPPTVAIRLWPPALRTRTGEAVDPLALRATGNWRRGPDAVRRCLCLWPLLPGAAAAAVRIGRGSVPLRLGGNRSVRRPAGTGSGSCCRESSPICFPGRAGTPHWAFSPRRATRCPSGCPGSRLDTPASASIARCVTRRGIARRPMTSFARRYTAFLAAAAADPRFTSSTVLSEIAKNYRLSAIDRLLYRARDHPEDA